MKRLIIGTLNEHKGRELMAMLDELPVKIELLSAFKGVKSVAETGATLRENAAIKALGFARQVVHPDDGRKMTDDDCVLSDDSGLEVDALNGAPGVMSARYAGRNATYPQLIAKLLRELRDVPAQKRTARFRCCLCLASPDGIVLEADGTCEGRILFEPRGWGGFGYDPLFAPDGFDQTFAELSPEVKNRLSHRGAAIREFKKLFVEHVRRQTMDDGG